MENLTEHIPRGMGVGFLDDIIMGVGAAIVRALAGLSSIDGDD